MKLFLEQSEGLNEPEISVKYDVIDDCLEKILGYIRRNVFSLYGVKDGETRVISPDDVYYFDSTDERTFVYLESEVYECSMKLYELEQQLAGASFVRISKSCIVNILKLESVRPLINSRYEAKLENGERLIINRHYLPAFKQKFGI